MDDRVVMIRPVATLEEVKSRIHSLYGYEVGKSKQLDGYDDLNFYVEVTASGEGNLTTRCVCKILNTVDSKQTDTIESQHRLVLFLGGKGISVPRPILNKYSKFFSLELFGQNEHVFRLLEFVPGKRLNDSTPAADLYRNVGDLIGQIYTTLKNYEDEVLKRRNLLWMLERVPELRNYVHAVPDEQRRESVTSVIKEFEARVVPAMPEMEKGVIHGDLNEHNILAEGGDVTGVIDFGDVCYAPVLFEVAISLAYMMIHAKDISVGKHILAGYQEHRKLTKLEADLLTVCVRARTAQSLVLGCYSALEAPNNDYILSSQKNGWTVLSQLNTISDSQIRTLWGI